jgi:hypothetical protein
VTIKKKNFRDMKNHINIKKNCINNIKYFELSNDEIIIMTLIPYINNKQYTDFSKIKNYKYTYKNKNLLLDVLLDIEKTNTKICKYCSIKFNKIQDLKKHIILECFEKEMEKKFMENDLIKLNNLNYNNTINNLNINSNNIINNLNINSNNITNLIPFDENWDLSMITELDKLNLIWIQVSYTTLLKNILKNDNNLNVIIDKNKEFGLVYKNNFDKYIKMEVAEIIRNSMDKLHKNLVNINEEFKNNSFFDKCILEYKNKEINKKYDCYNNDKDTEKIVNDHIYDIFNSKKDDSLQIMRDFLLNNENIELSPYGY